MMKINKKRDLVFADKYMSAVLYENVEGLQVDGVVVNLTPGVIEVEDVVTSSIFPWRSTIVKPGKIIKADRIAVLDIAEKENFGGVMLRQWQWFGDVYSGFPRQTPLYMSSIDTIGRVYEDSRVFTRQSNRVEEKQEFDLKLKCWWSPGQTDCFIHNEHPFLEVHTQIMGNGKMQKFRQNEAETMYEDVEMMPGFTHDAFCKVTGRNKWTYPYHRYYAETESVWLAVELHPVD